VRIYYEEMRGWGVMGKEREVTVIDGSKGVVKPNKCEMEW
jgi:hypothetical protein